MLKGFKNFIMRGNVIDLAVAVVMGSAFTAIVTALTDNLIKPILARVGGTEVTGLGIQLGAKGAENTFIDFGAIITATINFLIIAAVVYFIFVAPMNTIKEKTAKKKNTEPKEKKPTEVELLLEIRDLLKESKTNGVDVANVTLPHPNPRAEK